MKPVIAITTDEANYKRGLQSKVNSGYGYAVDEAGGTPILLQVMHRPDEHAKTIAHAADGLIVSGGESCIYPHLYGDGISQYTDYIYPPRDFWEHALIREFMAVNKPVMGICRGLQQLNIYFGGTLHFNIHQELPNIKGHWSGDTPMHFAAHAINIEKDSHFYNACGKEEVQINSFHYQGINKLGRELRVTALSPDGVIEAVEHVDSSRYIVAYQFHPEMMVNHEECCNRIFEDFIRQAAKTINN